jgi:rhomboid family GlyGly-CTERM serine protease
VKSGKVPAWTLLLCGTAALVHFVPAIGSALIYDRAAIESGQVWRLVTGSLVHLSPRHFTYDALALFLVGMVAELRGIRNLGMLYLTAALAIGVAIFQCAPELKLFAGLSGIVTGTVVFLCLDGLSEGDDLRWLWWGGLFSVALKILLEFSLDTSWVVASGDEAFVAVPLSHLVGAGTALMMYSSARHLRFLGQRHRLHSSEGEAC